MRTLFLCALIFYGHTLSASDSLQVYGYVKDSHSKKRLSKCILSITKDGEKFEKFRLSENGKYDVNLRLDAEYKLFFESKGYETKWLLIDTKNIPKNAQNGGFTLAIDMSLFLKQKNFDNKCLDEAIGKAKYDPSSGELEFDMKHTEKVQREIVKAWKDSDALNKAKFDKLMEKGLKALEANKVDKAKRLFEKAKKLIPRDDQVLDELVRLKSLIQKQ